MSRVCETTCKNCNKPTSLMAGILVPGGHANEAYCVCWSCCLFKEAKPVADWFRFTKKPKSPWTKFTPYHWQREINGKPLDYWPTKSKWRYRGQMHKGDVDAFIARMSHK